MSFFLLFYFPPQRFNHRALEAVEFRLIGNVLFNDALNTFLFTVIWRRSGLLMQLVSFTYVKITINECTIHRRKEGRKEGRKGMYI